MLKYAMVLLYLAVMSSHVSAALLAHDQNIGDDPDTLVETQKQAFIKKFGHPACNDSHDAPAEKAGFAGKPCIMYVYGYIARDQVSGSH